MTVQTVRHRRCHFGNRQRFLLQLTRTLVSGLNDPIVKLAKGDVRAICLEHPTISLAALKMLAGRLRRHAELVEALSLQG
jgi:hypothetical protein